MIKIAPSILSADFANLERDIRRIDTADYVHVDVMDGLFVPNITIGIPVVKSIRPTTALPLDVHLMIDRPVRYVEAFCQAMTEEARSYGCYQTSFETPNGLDSDNHYTTCYDLAILTCHALNNKNFRSIIREPSYTIKEITSGQTYSLNNKDAFLTSYPGAIGVKTGFTNTAGYCFVGAVETDDRLLISVVLGSGWPPNRSYKWKDTRKLMDYGMENFENVTISLGDSVPGQLPVEHGQAKICDISQPGTATLLLNPEEEQAVCTTDLLSCLDAPVRQGDSVGTVTLSINGETYRTYPVTAAASVKRINYRWCLERLVREYFYR